MCYKAKCSTCGKTTWGGCGKHLSSVYKGIPEGQHCVCREWPGVKLNDQSTGDEPQPSFSCTIL